MCAGVADLGFECSPLPHFRAPERPLRTNRVLADDLFVQFFGARTYSSGGRVRWSV